MAKESHISKARKGKQHLYINLMRLAAIFVCLLLILIAGTLIAKSSLLFKEQSLADILLSSSWNPEKGLFGILPIILGTVYVTGIALIIAVPVSILCSIYIAEYTKNHTRQTIKAFIDVLAGIPSVVYGMCAIIVLVPFVRDYIAPLFNVTTTGFCILTAGIILAIMVMPIIISVCVNVFRAISVDLREASLATGATKWQTIKKVVLRAGFPGMFSAILLGFGRAFGETIAVAMVVGNLPQTPSSVFDPGVTLPSIIATTYGEMMSVPLYDSAMMLLALILIIIVLIFNYLAGFVLRRSKGGGKYGY